MAYLTGFAKGEFHYAEAAKRNLLQISARPEFSKPLQLFARVYLKQMDSGQAVTASGSRAHKAWLKLSPKDQQIFWNATDRGEKNALYRHAQQQVLKKVRQKL